MHSHNEIVIIQMHAHPEYMYSTTHTLFAYDKLTQGTYSRGNTPSQIWWLIISEFRCVRLCTFSVGCHSEFIGDQLWTSSESINFSFEAFGVIPDTIYRFFPSANSFSFAICSMPLAGQRFAVRKCSSRLVYLVLTLVVVVAASDADSHRSVYVCGLSCRLSYLIDKMWPDSNFFFYVCAFSSISYFYSFIFGCEVRILFHLFTLSLLHTSARVILSSSAKYKRQTHERNKSKI